jgi:hypothetical protein
MFEVRFVQVNPIRTPVAGELDHVKVAVGDHLVNVINLAGVKPFDGDGAGKLAGKVSNDPVLLVEP